MGRKKSSLWGDVDKFMKNDIDEWHKLKKYVNGLFFYDLLRDEFL